MKNNAFKMSLLFLFFIAAGIALRFYLMSNLAGVSLAEQFRMETQSLACIFNKC